MSHTQEVCYFQWLPSYLSERHETCQEIDNFNL